MKTFSVAQGNVFLPVEHPTRAEGDETPIKALSIQFSEDPVDSSICRMRIVSPNGAAVEAWFGRNGALMGSQLRDAGDLGKPFSEIDKDCVAPASDPIDAPFTDDVNPQRTDGTATENLGPAAQEARDVAQGTVGVNGANSAMKPGNAN